MAPITLGARPQELVVELARGASFWTALVAPDDWPEDTTVELRFTVPDDPTTPATVWTATVTGPRAEFDQTDTAVNQVLDAGRTSARLVCVDGAGRVLLWGSGWVRVD